MTVMGALHSFLAFIRHHLKNSDSFMASKELHRLRYEFWIYQVICFVILGFFKPQSLYT